MKAKQTYYKEMRRLALDKREYYNVRTDSFGLREARKIFKHEGIKIDYYPLPAKIKALYMCADGDYSVALQKNLPTEPKLFSLIHELKHHFCDQGSIKKGYIACGDYNRNELIEVGAEVFAAEFIYPENEFYQDIYCADIPKWTAESIVRFKRNCKAKISYQFIKKRLERFGLIAPNQFQGVQFLKLEYKLFGMPFRRKRKPA